MPDSENYSGGQERTMSLQDYIDTAIQNSPLSFFCDVKVIPGEIEQRREDLKSDIALTARLENRDLGSAAALAIAVIGGFVAGLPLLLVVLPAMLRAIYRE